MVIKSNQIKLKNAFEKQNTKQLEIEKGIVVDSNINDDSDEESFDSADRRMENDKAKMGSLLPDKNKKNIKDLKNKILELDSSDGDVNEMPITPRKDKKEDIKVKNKSPFKELKDVSNYNKLEENEKSGVERESKLSLKQAERSRKEIDKTSNLKRITTEEYDRKVLTIRELNIKDKMKFVVNPPPQGRIIQVSIFRDRSGIKNRFYPKYHVTFSVS